MARVFFFALQFSVAGGIFNARKIAFVHVYGATKHFVISLMTTTIRYVDDDELLHTLDLYNEPADRIWVIFIHGGAW